MREKPVLAVALSLSQGQRPEAGSEAEDCLLVPEKRKIQSRIEQIWSSGTGANPLARN
jgi:hypothetical protein